MKTFEKIRNLYEAKNEVVSDTKISGIDVKILKDGEYFAAIIDGDLLDKYNSEREAMNNSKKFIKQYKVKN